MTQYTPDPYGQPPLSYSTPAYAGDPYGYVQPKPARPTSVTVIAIIAIILGGGSALCTPFGALPYVLDMGPGMGQGNPTIDVVKHDPVLFPWMIGTMALAMVVGFVELIGAIGSLKLKPWGRTMLLAYAWISIVEGAIGVVFNFMFYLPKLQTLPANDPIVQMTLKTAPIAAIGGTIAGLVLPLCVLYFFSRPNVKAAFAGVPMAGTPTPSDYGQPPYQQPGGYPPGYGQ